VAVEREGYRKPVREFGPLRLEEITVERIEAYLARKHREGLAPATLHRQLAVLSLIFGTALRRGLVRTNPVPLVQRPRAQRRRWRILTPAEVGAVERALDAMLAEAEEGHERDDLATARLLFVTMMGTGIRRGEALGLRWRSVLLADPLGPVLRVEETWVRNSVETPKSQAGVRTIALGKRVADELFDHRRRTPFSGTASRSGSGAHPVRQTGTKSLIRRR
jgi:integrase